MSYSMCVEWSASSKKFNVVMHSFPHISMSVVSSHDTFAEAESAMHEELIARRRKSIAAALKR